MSVFPRRSPWQVEWDRLRRREVRFRERADRRSAPRLERLLEDKVPAKLRDTLNAAFCKAFALVLDKGAGILEKAARTEKRADAFRAREETADRQGDKRSLRAVPRAAGGAGRVNLVLSGAEGVGLGLLGVGLPDIPLFTAVLLKSVYEIAASYGCGHTAPAERIFVLRVIQGGLARGGAGEALDRGMDEFMRTGRWPEEVTVEGEIAAAASCLSGELLYMKFLQGIPIVGAAGGAYDTVYLRRVQTYADIKYHKRFLLRQREKTAPPGRRGNKSEECL